MNAAAELISEELETQAGEPIVEEIFPAEVQPETTVEALSADAPADMPTETAEEATDETEAVMTADSETEEAGEDCAACDEPEVAPPSIAAPVARPFRQYTIKQLEEHLTHQQRALDQARLELGMAVLRHEETDAAYDAVAECERAVFEAQCAIEALPHYETLENNRLELERLTTGGPTRAERVAELRAAYDTAKSAFLHAITKEKPTAGEKEELAAKMLHAAKKAASQMRINNAMDHIRANRIDLDNVKRLVGRMK